MPLRYITLSDDTLGLTTIIVALIHCRKVLVAAVRWRMSDHEEMNVYTVTGLRRIKTSRGKTWFRKAKETMGGSGSTFRCCCCRQEVLLGQTAAAPLWPHLLIALLDIGV